MCGITGFYKKNLKQNFSFDILKKMNSCLNHRGPDAEGYWKNESEGIYFAQKRLSIIDLSKNGNQPMESCNKNYIICYNGEIYNFKELREELIKEFGVSFKGKSDTEILLESISCWGLENSLSKVNGMFAFSLWDRKSKKLYLCRDRFGEKPLHFYQSNNYLMFSSEIKSFLKNPNFNKKLNLNSLKSYVRYGYIKGEDSIFKNIKKVKPGYFVEFFFDEINNLKIKYNCYWDPVKIAREQKKKIINSEKLILENLEKKLDKSVSEKMVADVNISCFLSGGIDSSLVASIMQKTSEKKINTFTIGFDDNRFDESKNAKKIATHLNTDHSEFIINEKDALNVIKELPHIYDEPFADSSQIPTILISKYIKEQDIKVTLTGDGGDEIFGGYNRYIWGTRVLGIINKLSLNKRNALKEFINFFNVDTWDSFGIFYNKVVPKKFSLSNFGQKMFKFSEIIEKNDELECYNEIVSVYSNPENLITRDLDSNSDNNQILIDGFTFKESMMLNDVKNYLLYDILVKVDRATMSQSIESRIPYLDKDLFKLAWQIPENLKIKNGVTKYFLRKLLSKYLPDNLYNQPKMGFGVPLDMWLRGPLKLWAESKLDIDQKETSWLFKPNEIDRLWNNHQKNKANNSYKLWNIIMIKSWLEEYGVN